MKLKRSSTKEPRAQQRRQAAKPVAPPPAQATTAKVAEVKAPTRARARKGGEKGPLTPREEMRGVKALRLYGQGKGFAEIARLVGARNMNVVKRLVRAVGSRLRQQNDTMLEELLVREDARDEAIMGRLLEAFLVAETEPADLAKLADSMNRVREAKLRRLDRVGVLPRQVEKDAPGPASLVEVHGFDRVQRLAFALMEVRHTLGAKPKEKLLSASSGRQ